MYRVIRAREDARPPIGSSTDSGENVFHHTPMHVGEPEIAASVAVCETFVIDAQEVQNGRVEIVHMNRMLGHIDAELVGTAVSHSTSRRSRRQARQKVLSPCV